ncbi:MAG: conjugal transfer protein TraF [Rickettsia sp.]|uniref:conjugal transfer protein TraF n=1 Tax=Rickettsia sp. TaxID=789 RepID=UPI00397E1914
MNEEQQQELEKIQKQEQERAKARAEVEPFSKELDDLKYMMIRYPENLDHVYAYKKKEAEMLDSALKLDHSYRLVNLLHPNDVNHKENPVNLYGRKIHQQEEQKAKEEKIAELANNIELFFVFSSDCPYSTQAAPVVSQFTQKYKIEIEELSTNGEKSQYFKTHFNQELINMLGIESVPSLILVTKDGKTRFEIARGAVSFSELEEKMLLAHEILKDQELKSQRAAEQEENSRVRFKND